MMNMIQMIFDGFSSPVLYASLAWFGIVGFLVNACLVMLLTRMSFKQIVQPLLIIHVQCLAFSFVLAPVLSVVFYVLITQILLGSSRSFSEISFYNSFGSLVLIRSISLLCSFFVQTSCAKWRQAFLISYSFLMVLGVLVFQGLGLIQ